MSEDKSNIEIAMEKVTKMVQTILAIGIAVATFILFYALLFKDVTGTAKDIIMFILGCVSSNLTQIISYYFGSSKSSDDKSKIITNLSENQNITNVSDIQK